MVIADGASEMNLDTQRLMTIIDGTFSWETLKFFYEQKSKIIQMFHNPDHRVVSFSDSDSSNIAKTAYTGSVVTGKVKNGTFIKDTLQNFNSQF
jgi:hypothetical protein